MYFTKNFDIPKKEHKRGDLQVIQSKRRQNMVCAPPYSHSPMGHSPANMISNMKMEDSGEKRRVIHLNTWNRMGKTDRRGKDMTESLRRTGTEIWQPCI